MIQKLMDSNIISRTFPEINHLLINRDNNLESIENLFDSGAKIVVVDGPEIIGKTTLLYQFCRRHPDEVISYFLKSSRNYTNDLKLILYDLSNQINWILQGKVLGDVDDFEEKSFKSLMYKLSTLSRTKNKTYYFIIDGLNNLNDKDRRVIDFLLGNLPLELRGIKILISYDERKLKEFIGGNSVTTIKTFTMSGFSLDQTIEFFKGTPLQNEIDEIEGIRSICKGNAGHLDSIKRIINQKEINVESFLNDLPTKLPELFTYEWKLANLNDKAVEDFLSVLAFDDNFYTIEEIANIIESNVEKLMSIISNLTFLEINESLNQVFYTTESFKKYARNKLQHNKKNIVDKILDYLLSDASNISKIVSIPDFVYENNRLPEIVSMLTPDNLRQLLKRSQSISSLKKITEFGITAASYMNENTEFIKFCIQNSALEANYNSVIYQSEIQALLELYEFDKAMSMAQNNQLIEDRLHLLSIIARHQKEHNQIMSPELLTQIDNLIMKIDFKKLGERSIDIAKDIVYFNPEVAIQIIEDFTGVEKGENALDHAYATLSLEALDSGTKHSVNNDGVDIVKSKIKNPNVKNIFKDFAVFLKKYSEFEILNEIRDIDSTTDQLYILSNWAERIETISSDAEVKKVILYAFNKAISNPEYAPNAGIYRKLSSIIIHLKDEDIIKELVGLFDSQIANIIRTGPIDDYIQLSLNLAKVEYRLDKNKGVTRLTELYFYLMDNKNITIYNDGFAMILNVILELDSTLKISEMNELNDLLTEEVDATIKKLILGTANHFEEVKGIIKALSKHLPYKSLKIIEEINTKNNREKLYLQLVDTLSDKRIELEKISIIKETLLKIEDPDYLDEAIVIVINSLFDYYGNEVLPSNFHEILRMSFKVKHSHMKCDVLCKAYIISCTNEELKPLSDSFLVELNKTWLNIDVAWYKVDVGFQIIKSLAQNHISIARDYLELTNNFRNEMSLYDPNISDMFITSIKLVIRAFKGLIPSNSETDMDFEKVKRLILFIPSKGEQALIWSNLAISYYNCGRITEGNKIVSTYLRECINKLSQYDIKYKNYVIINVAPVLYLSHKNTTLDLLENLESVYKDEAYYIISRYILTKNLHSEPYDAVLGENAKITYEEITDLCELMLLMESDAIIYSTIHEIMEVLSNKKNDLNYTRDQLAEIFRRVEDTINQKLPACNFIEHEGYKLISYIELYRVKKPDTSYWLKLIDEVSKIENTSDRLFIYTILVSYLPKSLNDKATKMMDTIDSLVEDIPSILERITRYKFMGRHFIKIDSGKSKRFIKKAMELSVDKSSDNTYTTQRELIDLAHKINPEFAESLVSITDNDPARKKIKHEAKKELNKLELKELMLAGNKSSTEISKASKEDIISAAWKLLGSLNANRVGTIHFEDSKQYFEIASQLPLNLSFPIYSWVIENANARLSTKSQNEVNDILRPLFESTLLGSELFLVMAKNNKENLRIIENQLPSNKGDSLIIKSNEREKAINYIMDWAKNLVGNTIIKICDPYFGIKDLDLIYKLWEINSGFEFEILTSIKQQKQDTLNEDVAERFSEHWRINVSNQNPPRVKIVLIGLKDGASPIHDRWILGSETGIRSGTSFNSLGLIKDSELSIMRGEQCIEKLDILNRYLNSQVMEHSGNRIKYETFYL